VLRSGNKKAALLTLIGDALKGWVAVFVAQKMGFSDNVVGLVAMAVFFGHLYPVFLKFKGGKGVATAIGALIALDPLLGLAVIGTWLFIAFAFRYSSLAALVSAATAPVWLARFGPPQSAWLGLVLAALVWVRHRANIGRLLGGAEPRIGRKAQ